MAAQEAVSRALADGAIERADFTMMFATAGYDQPTIVRAVRAATGGAPLCGCSAEGVIVQADQDESNFSLAVLAISSDEMTFQNGIGMGMSADATGLGRAIAGAIRPDLLADARALFVFPDGVSVDFDGFRLGIEEALDLDRVLPLFGGSASDNWVWEQTWQYCDDEVESDGVAWALLSGDVRLATAVNHGCVSLGVEHEITRCEGTRVHELDGRPALEVLHEYMTPEEMEDWAMVVINMPMAVQAPGDATGDDRYLIRVVLSKDDVSGSVTLPTRVEAGTRIWMARRDYEQVVTGVGRLVTDLTRQLDGEQPKLVLQFECAGRCKSFVRDEIKSELQRQLHDQLPPAAWFGFYTYGGIEPLAARNCFHNYASVVAALY